MSEAGKPITILVIDDEAAIRKLISRMLELEGYNVLQAEDGEKGLELLKTNQVALILLDLKLPGDGGWTVLEKLKSDPELSMIPVIVCSGAAEPENRSRALNIGAVDYLVKPFSLTTIVDAVVLALQSDDDTIFIDEESCSSKQNHF